MARASAYDRDTALQSAMALFWDKGYHATSLKDLETALAMKPGSIYAAFTSKENLYLLALERYFNASCTRFRTQMAQAQSPLAALAEQFRAYARLAPDAMARQACMLTKTLVDTRSTDPEIVQATRDYLSRMVAEFSAGFARAIAAGELPADANPDRLARRYQANLSALRLALHQGLTPEEVNDLAEEMAREIEQLRQKAPPPKPPKETT